MSVQQERELFNSVDAPRLAADVGVTEPAEEDSRSNRFAYFADEKRFVVVAGAQEGNEVDLAFALGLTYRGDRQLVLVLPQHLAFATLQRAPWFKAQARPEVWLHDGMTARLQDLSTTDATVAQLTARLTPRQSLEDELHDALTPIHLGVRSPAVYDLVDWATTHPALDASHRRGERAWHCMGQQVLSIRRSVTGLTITAGIDYSDPASAPSLVHLAGPAKLDAGQLETLKRQVIVATEARLTGSPPIHRPDEHWLQAVIRRDPSLVGVEHPALRELPAWRPRASKTDPSKRWGRGYIDLIGVDGHGDLRIVETKLASNQDDLLVFQGLDYYIWAQAYRDVLVRRLGASTKSALEIHYVIGDTDDGQIHISKYASEQARSLLDSVRWRFQTIHKWYRGPADTGRAASQLLPSGELPPT
jgi:hypothetical protein